MIEHNLDAEHSILYLRPKSALQKDDFAELARTVDPYIEVTGDLAGLIIETPAFPGWDSLGAIVAHFRFVRDHHKRIRKVAVVTEAALGNVAEKLASHFVSATIRHFPAGEIEAARRWIMNQATNSAEEPTRESAAQ
jgi:SpoIIAA-like